MSDKNYRIRTNIGDDSVVNFELKQGIKTINILSLEINPEEEYEVQTSNYGVVVGRVLANKALGVPNVKVSVFIPISESDENDYVISNEYPFKTIQSKDINGTKYSLLGKKNGTNGSFPTKNMVLDNNGTLEVYDKYWKYTTVTNESGDYMFFGIPTGTTQIHYDCDLSDIGILSQKPYDLINKGYNENLFKSKTEFLDTDVTNAVHIISQDFTVHVYPFWGDKKANKIGITRKDIDVNYEFTPTCIFMGSSITDSSGSYISTGGVPIDNCGNFNSLTTSVGDIEIIRYKEDGGIEEVKDNVKNIIDGNGVWCYQIPMNLDRIGTDEYGNIVAIKDSGKGIPTRARVRFRISLKDTESPETGTYTAKMLVPCNPPLAIRNDGLTRVNTEKTGGWKNENEKVWKNAVYRFGTTTPDYCFRDLYWGKVYSIKQYYPRFHYEFIPRDITYGDSHYKTDGRYRPRIDTSTLFDEEDEDSDVGVSEAQVYDYRGFPTRYAFQSSCISSIDLVSGLNLFPYTTMYAGAEEHIDYRTIYWFYFHLSEYSKDYNMTSRGLHFCFENDWINGCLYFPRVAIRNTSGNNYEFFGDGNNTSHVWLSGRHNSRWDGRKFSVADSSYDFTGEAYQQTNKKQNLAKEAVLQSSISFFSRVNFTHGIVKSCKTSLGETVFYYRCGYEEWAGDYSSGGKEYKMLYSTDIILLGNINDIYDSLPKLYNNLPSTTAIFPPLSTPPDFSECGMNKQGYTIQLEGMDREDTPYYDIFGNHKEIVNFPWQYTSSEYASRFYEQSKNNHTTPDTIIRSILRHGSLFFGIRYRHVDDFLQYDTPSFVNTSRICELDVHNDSAITVPSPNNGKMIAIRGIIDRYDISTNDNRSAFASMNYNIEKKDVDNKTKYKRFVATPLYISGFDGRLEGYIAAGSGSGGWRNDFLYANDNMDRAYMMFRFGIKYDENSQPLRAPFKNTRCMFSTNSVEENYLKRCNGDLYIPTNSFYFYFGLRSGLSAIDVLRKKYIGSKKKVDTELSSISCEVLETGCKDNEEIGNVYVRFYDVQFPITYVLYYKNTYYMSGEYGGSRNHITQDERGYYMSLTNLPIGVYKIDITDSNNREYSSYFSILSYSPSLNTSTYIDSNNNWCIDFLSDDMGYTVTDIEYISDLKIKIETTHMLTGDTTNDIKRYINVSFNTEIDDMTISIYGNTIKLIGDYGELNSINASISLINNDCAKSYVVYSFEKEQEPTPIVNGVPTKYLSNWGIEYQYASSGPDTVFSGNSFNVWDSINTAIINKENARGWGSFSGLKKEDVLSFISLMCSSVYGTSSMYVNDTSENTNYNSMTIYPDYNSNYDLVHIPYNNWYGQSGLNVSVSKYGDISSDYSIPHIVGSNYPVSYTKRTYIKNGANNGYINNATIRKDSETWGINLFGLKHSKITTYDKPGELNPYEQGEYDGNISGIENYYGVRSVDKRFDYQFVIKTPLILPSGYDDFKKLVKKAIIPGSMSFKLYGGFRLDFNEQTWELLSYNFTYNADGTVEDVTGGPSQNARLFDANIYEDDNTQIQVAETKYKIWDNDIDNVTFETAENGEPSKTMFGKDGLFLSFTSCSENFSDGRVQAGELEEVGISYKPAIEIVRGGKYDYDLCYIISGQTGQESSRYYPTLKGSSLTFKTTQDINWNGSTYTDLDTEMSHNDGVFPEWARRYETETPYNANDRRELAIYSCLQSGSDEFTVESVYCVTMKILENDLPTSPRYISGPDGYISAVYDDEDGSINTLNDAECGEYINFTIKDSDTINTHIVGDDDSFGFIIIPTRRVYTIETSTTSLKQGVVYNMGAAYYADYITVDLEIDPKKATIKLNTPLIEDGKVDFNGAEKLYGNGNWHTIGNINNYYCDNAYVKYIKDEAKFVVEPNDTSIEVFNLYFEIENGLKYKVVIDFR